MKIIRPVDLKQRQVRIVTLELYLLYLLKAKQSGITIMGITKWSLLQGEMNHPSAKWRCNFQVDIYKLFKNKKTSINLIGNGTRIGMIEMLYILIGVLVTWMYKFIKAKWILFLRSVHFTVYKFHIHLKKKKKTVLQVKRQFKNTKKFPKTFYHFHLWKDQTPNSLLCPTLLQFSSISNIRPNQIKKTTIQNENTNI